MEQEFNYGMASMGAQFDSRMTTPTHSTTETLVY